MDPNTKSGPCVVCGRSADTGCGFSGEANYIIAGLTFLGVPKDRATRMVQGESETPPPGRFTAVFVVCEECAAKAGAGMDPEKPFRVGPMSSPEGVPAYRQPQSS